MAEAYRNVGRAITAANNAASTLFTVPADTFFILSTLQVCNTGTAPTLFRVHFQPAGAAFDASGWLYYDANLGPSVSLAVTIGITAAPGDVLRVYSRDAGVAFNAFGTVVTP